MFAYLLVSLVIIILVSIKIIKRKQYLSKINNSFSEGSNSDEKLAHFENEYEVKKEITNLNNIGAP